MSLSVGRYKLYTALKDLALRWEECKDQWHDSVRREFEEKQWAPLEPHVKAALAAMDRLDQVLIKVRNDCS
jgi:hypothetical protein